MVQGSRIINVSLQVGGRIALLIFAFVLGFFFFPTWMHEFTTETLGYKRPPGFFGFTFADWGVSYSLAQALLIGVIFGTLGKKIDYIFITVFFLFMSLNHLFTTNMTWLVYSGFVGASLLGILIGFGLRIVKQRFFSSK